MTKSPIGRRYTTAADVTDRLGLCPVRLLALSYGVADASRVTAESPRPGPRSPEHLGSRHSLAIALAGLGQHAHAVDHHRQNLTASTPTPKRWRTAP
jgi:hypothetical protein